MKLSVLLLVLAVAIVGGAAFLFSGSNSVPSTNQETSMDQEEDPSSEEVVEGSNVMEARPDVMEGVMTPQAGGSFESYAPEKLARASSGDVVLFFRASWCPTCRALEADLKANSTQIPQGLTILDVSYDAETALKQKYGVTYQHTLVQVDAEGNMVTKWSGSQDLASLLTQVQ